MHFFRNTVHYGFVCTYIILLDWTVSFSKLGFKSSMQTHSHMDAIEYV